MVIEIDLNRKEICELITYFSGKENNMAMQNIHNKPLDLVLDLRREISRVSKIKYTLLKYEENFK